MRAKSKVTIKIDLKCDQENFEANLKLLIEQLEKAEEGTELFYAATRKPLKKLLMKIIKEVPFMLEEAEKTHRKDKPPKSTFSLSSWEGAISLDATIPRPINPEPLNRK